MDSEQSQFGVKDLAVFVAGLALLIAGIAAIPHLGDWATRWGLIPVYLSYFLYMSIAGRYFQKGLDTAWKAVKGAAAQPVPERSRQ